MNELNNAIPAQRGTASAQPADATTPPTPFTDFPGLVRHLPMFGERKLRALVKQGVIPSIRPPKTRKLGFFLPSVETALLRYQKGGIE